MKTTSVFVYGTLTHPEIVQILLGRTCNPYIPMTTTTSSSNNNMNIDYPPVVGPPARLVGYSRHPVQDRVFPAIIPSMSSSSNIPIINDDNNNNELLLSLTSSSVIGHILQDVTPNEMKLLDWFEADEYDRCSVQVQLLQNPTTTTKTFQNDGNKNNDDSSSSSSSTVPVEAYIWKSKYIPKLDLSKSWSYENFCQTYFDWYLENTVIPCRLEMEELGLTS